MNTCATCKHWDPPSPLLWIEMGNCMWIVNDECKLAVTESEFYTKPEFGCTLWEAKP